jgi:hypothetical protein
MYKASISDSRAILCSKAEPAIALFGELRFRLDMCVTALTHVFEMSSLGFQFRNKSLASRTLIGRIKLGSDSKRLGIVIADNDLTLFGLAGIPCG